MSVANSFYLDASALAKRYVPEKGSAQVDTILDKVSSDRIRLLNIGAGEVVSILVRKRNGGELSITEFKQAVASFDAEILGTTGVTRTSVTSRLVTSSFSLIVAHSINSTDALILKSALTVARKSRRPGDDLVLAASDQRLVRAVQAEGLVTFNAETQDHAALAALVGP